MYYHPTNRDAARALIARKIVAETLDMDMLKEVKQALSTYTRKQVNKYLFDHVENNSCAYLYKNTSYSTEHFTIMPKDRILQNNPVIYRENITFWLKENSDANQLEQIENFVNEKIAYIETESLPALKGIQKNLDKIITKHDKLKKELTELLDAKGMHALRDVMPS